MVINLWNACKQPCIIHLVICRNQYLPTDSADEALIHLLTKIDASVVVAILNSSLFYWWFIILSDCRHLNLREIENYPVGLEKCPGETKQIFAELSKTLMNDLQRHAQRKECMYKATGKVVYDEFYLKYSKNPS